MKIKLIYITVLLFSNILQAQIKIQNGIWITSEGFGIDVRDSLDDYKICNSNDQKRLFFSYNSDSLILNDYYFSSENNYAKEMSDTYGLKILYLSDDTAILSPITKLSQAFFKNTDTLIFNKQSSIKNDSFAFDKLHFVISGSCLESCPDQINIEIDGKGNFTVNKIVYSGYHPLEIDTAQSGCFSGKLDAQELSSLRCDIFSSYYKNLKFDNPRGTYLSKKNLEVLEGSSVNSITFIKPFVPLVLHSLIIRLTKISMQANLEKCK